MEAGFVFLDEALSGIRWDAKYATSDNFTGTPVDGYEVNRVVGSDALADALRELGYDVREAHDGPSAIEAVGDFRPSIAVLDIGLPVMDGYELARRLTALCPGVQFVAVSGYGQESDQERSRQSGFVGHLVKPIALNDIATLLEQLDQTTPATR